jgi:hypothetical protein
MSSPKAKKVSQPKAKTTVHLTGEALQRFRSLLAGMGAACRLEFDRKTLTVTPEGEGPSEAGGTVTLG